MGSKVSRILKRLFDYPIKRKPICFFRQEDFSSTGEPLPKEETDQSGPLTEYDKLVQSFYTRLLEQRRQSKENLEKNKKWSMEKVTNKFPGWNEMTIANLHSLFLLFDHNLNGMLNFDDLMISYITSGYTKLFKKHLNTAVIMICMEIGAVMPSYVCSLHFAEDIKTSWVLKMVYYFHPQDEQELRGLAKLCLDIAENIKFVSSLSVGEQLEYGLF